MKLRKAKPILFEHPIIISYIANGVFKYLYEKHGNKPGLLVKVLSETQDFIEHIEYAVNYILVKDFVKLNLEEQPQANIRYYVNFYTLKRTRRSTLEKSKLEWAEVPDNFSIEEFINAIEYSRSRNNQMFGLDSVIKKQIYVADSIKYSYEIFVSKGLETGNIIDEEL